VCFDEILTEYGVISLPPVVLSCRPDLGRACMIGAREGCDITPYKVNISFIIWL